MQLIQDNIFQTIVEIHRDISEGGALCWVHTLQRSQVPTPARSWAHPPPSAGFNLHKAGFTFLHPVTAAAVAWLLMNRLSTLLRSVSHCLKLNAGQARPQLCVKSTLHKLTWLWWSRHHQYWRYWVVLVDIGWIGMTPLVRTLCIEWRLHKVSEGLLLGECLITKKCGGDTDSIGDTG